MAYKPRPIKTTVAAAVGDAFSEFQTLAEEMRETADNMENGGMGHLPKCEAASDAADELESHIDEPEVPDCLATIEVEATEMVNKDKRKGPSRDTRLANAQALLEAAKVELENMDTAAFLKHREALEKTRIEAGLDGESPGEVELEEKAEELAQELGEHVDFTVDFPGMYG